MSQARFQRMQREKARREKAAAKTARRAERASATPDPDASLGVDQDAVLAQLAELHERFADGAMSFEDFETTKAELTARLQVE